ncbi:MAG: carnitine 3-dehydrogenase [Gammaproteobacteria bacterium]|nr:MAG: carnitine 3-dehydrogenase [Gammaproteobacteria bacterium]
MSQKAAIIGGGVIGGGWAARFLLNGWDVAVFDPDPEADRKIGEVLVNARRSLPALYDMALPEEGQLVFHDSLEEALAGCAWIQESAPERLDLKHKVLADVVKHAPDDAIIASSTSGFRPSELQSGVNGDGRVMVAHPFNPVYLLPLVELVPTAANASAMVERAGDILTGIGMKPLVVRKEIDAHIADRLLEAVWRESLWLVSDGICTTEELDDAIRYGFGLRWAQMGLFETYRVAGGEAGMRHFMAQFGPALEWPWTRLMDVPEFNDELVELIASQSDAQSGHMSIRELERRRDDNLVGIIRALRHTGSGAGSSVIAHESVLANARDAGDVGSAGSAGSAASADGGHAGAGVSLPVTVERVIPSTWTDYNGHMNETWYLALGAQANDRFMELVGADAGYVTSGKSYFTAENHLCYLRELHAGERVKVTSQLLKGEGKKLQLLHCILDENGELAATMESLMLHMDMNARRSSEPEPEVAERIRSLAAQHAAVPQPPQVGRFVGAPR